MAGGAVGGDRPGGGVAERGGGVEGERQPREGFGAPGGGDVVVGEQVGGDQAGGPGDPGSDQRDGEERHGGRRGWQEQPAVPGEPASALPARW